MSTLLGAIGAKGASILSLARRRIPKMTIVKTATHTITVATTVVVDDAETPPFSSAVTSPPAVCCAARTIAHLLGHGRKLLISSVQIKQFLHTLLVLQNAFSGHCRCRVQVDCSTAVGEGEVGWDVGPLLGWAVGVVGAIVGATLASGAAVGLVV